MELKHFEIKDLEVNWANIASFSFPHFSARLTFTANWDQKFTIFVSLWQKPDKEFTYSFDDYESAMDMMVCLHNTNKEALVLDFKKVKVDKDDFSKEEIEDLRKTLKLTE